MKDFKREEVIELAERIFIHAVQGDEMSIVTMEIYARNAIRAAMIFREEEQELFKKDK